MESKKARFKRLEAVGLKKGWGVGAETKDGKVVGYRMWSLSSGMKGVGYGPDGKLATLDEVGAALVTLPDPPISLAEKVARFVAVFDTRRPRHRREDITVPANPSDNVVLEVYPNRLRSAYTALLDLLPEKYLPKVHVDTERSQITFPASALRK